MSRETNPGKLEPAKLGEAYLDKSGQTAIRRDLNETRSSSGKTGNGGCPRRKRFLWKRTQSLPLSRPDVILNVPENLRCNEDQSTENFGYNGDLNNEHLNNK